MVAAVIMGCCAPAQAQITERQRPAEWSNLVPGARFMDRFRPMEGSELRSDVWGADYVRPRLVDNGIEDKFWSYWGGNIVRGEDGAWHLFVAAWLEASEKGHMEWHDSWVVHATAPTHHGPFRPKEIVGRGHNPEIYRTDDGTWVLYVIDGRYTSRHINGPWEKGTFAFDPQGKPIIEGLSNLSFARRPEGGWLMVCRGGGIWTSDDGLTTWRQVSDGSVYPKVDGRFEDPVLWRDSVQYNLIVNDWLGRIAYYLRSADGLHWQVDDGEAYMPGIARHKDGSREEWFKYERMRILQDEHGRAIQANFAVIDTIKWDDKPLDRHSSKNICIPLDPGLLLTAQGLAGCIVAFLFFCSDHPAVDSNWLVLLLNPLPLVFLGWTLRAERQRRTALYHRGAAVWTAAFMVAAALIPQEISGTVMVLALCLLLRSVANVWLPRAWRSD